MDTSVLDFIRDRFNSLEDNMNNGFNEVKETMNSGFTGHNDRITSLESDRDVKKGKIIAYSTIGGGFGTLLIWCLGKIF